MLLSRLNFTLLQGQEGLQGNPQYSCRARRSHPPTPFLFICSLITSQRSQTEHPQVHSAPQTDGLCLATQCFGKLLLGCQYLKLGRFHRKNTISGKIRRSGCAKPTLSPVAIRSSPRPHAHQSRKRSGTPGSPSPHS